ncbi:uncharacterized protein [Pocillopora verrucosa]|uniref:uncharacterized protein isoform X4 n=1 Tax=Pocillopora verrucosa TaxID=203993 RepID=UPI0033424428
MCIRVGNSGDVRSVRISRIKRIWFIILSVGLLQGPSQAFFNDSFQSSSPLSTNLTDPGKDGIHLLNAPSSSEKQDLKNKRRLGVSSAKEIRRRSTRAKAPGVSNKIPLERANFSDVTLTIKAQRIPSQNVTHFSNNVTHFYDLTRSLNDINKLRSALQTSRGNSSPKKQASTGKRSRKGGKRRAERDLKLSLNKPDRSKLQTHYERESKSDIAKTHFNSSEKKRRKYSSKVTSGQHHRTRLKHQERSLGRFKRNIAVSDRDELKQKRFMMKRRSLQHLPFRLGGERVLLRFKRKSILGQDDVEAQSSDLKEHKGKKGRQTPQQKHVKPRSVFPGKSSTFPLNGVIKGEFLKETDWRAPSATINSYNKALVDRNVIPHATYDPVVYGAKSSSLSLNPNKLSSVPKEYSAVENRRQSVSNINRALYPLASTVSFIPKSNQAMTLKSELRTPQIASLWRTVLQNAPVPSQSNVPQPVRYEYGAGQQQRNSLQNTDDQSKKQFIPTSQRALYNYGHQFNYQPQFIKSQIALAGGNPRITSFSHMRPTKPLPFFREGARINPEWPLSSPTANLNNLLNFENGLSQRSRVPQGLVLYLDLENVQNGRATYASLNGDVTGTDKRTEIKKFFGSCGKVARLNNGSEILLNGKQLKMKPRQAVSIAAWIKLDSNKGYHSIFDTVGGHSMHQQGQYHFEIQDGSVRWFHRNETGIKIFSVETDPIIPANVWNHVVGTYDAHTGIAKIFVNGGLKAEAAGKGLLSQDWDAHAGIGKHKNQRFLQGEVDEFRIYNKALSQEEIGKLMKVCSFERVCGGLFNSPKGILESPEWPRSYKGKTTCAWHLSVDPRETITLSFKRFSLDEDGTCKNAKLIVRDGSGENSEALGVYCGTKRPTGITSSGNHLFVQFTSTEGGKGKGFLISYNTETVHQTKKTERPPTPTQADDSQRCAVTRPEYNVTLIGGIKSGIFSEAKHVHDMDLCTKHCCLRKSCDLAFMIRDSCYLVRCTNQSLCKTKRARPSNMNPSITFVSHLQSVTPEPELPVDGSAYNKAITSSISKPTTLPAKDQPICHHTAVSYNVTLVGGINAGKFSTYGRARNMDECIRHCCRDDKCDVSFMIQGNCYAVECADAEGCQVKRAKPSSYNPTVAYVYRGNERPIGDPLPGAEKPNSDACDKLSVSNTIFNVTLRGGIKSGNFTDKGVVKHMDECSAYCCADGQCNVAFLIRDNCFLVSCKDYESCQIKPALSEYYHPRLAYVNWSPPDDEIPANRWYASLGCWKDTESFAVSPLEGADPLLTEPYLTRQKPIDTCAQVARKHDFKVFAIQNGGACLSGPKAGRTFNQFGESSSCKAGKGGLFANDVYRLTDIGYISLGCWNDSGIHALPVMEHSDEKLDDFYKSRLDPLRKCGEVARKRGYPVFALQRGGMCFGGPRAEIDYKMYGISRRCRDGLGGTYANSVYRLIDNLEVEPTESTNNFTSPSGATGSSTSSTATTGSSSSPSSTNFTPTTFSGTQRSPTTSPSPTPEIQENYLTLQNGLPHKNTYTAANKPKPSDVSQCRASAVHNDVTLVGGINAGKFTDLGNADNMSLCTQRCCMKSACDVAFMLENECYGVSCLNESLCESRPARNPARYNPRIAYVYHDTKKDKASPQQKNVCWDGEILSNYTLVGGINAGTFSDNGKTTNMDICMQFCCKRDTCDLAFMIEDDCYSVSCNSNGACEPRKARPTHYLPRIAIRKKPQGNYNVKGVFTDMTSTPGTTTPLTSSVSQSSSPTPATSPSPTLSTISEVHQADSTTNPTVKVAHSCDATPIEYNVTLKMGLHSGVFQKVGRVDSMDDCIEMSCKEPRSDVAFMLGSMCYAVHCYSADLCKTVPIFGSSISRLNLNPAISFLKKNSQFGISSLVTTNNNIAQDKCRDSTITYNVTLRGGIDAGNFTERSGVLSMRDCIGKCCDDTSCDLAFMFGDHCYSVECQSEKLCQAVLAKPSHLEPKVSYVSRGFYNDKDKGTMFSASDQTPTCRADQKSQSKIFSNKTLVGGLEAGRFSFEGVVSDMHMCMDRCCAQQGCNVAYMVDKNCFSVACYSPSLCKISDTSSTNGEVEISTIFESTAERPVEKHSMVVYVIIGVVGFAAGAGGILWAVCMFIRRHRLRSRHRQDTQ